MNLFRTVITIGAVSGLFAQIANGCERNSQEVFCVDDQIVATDTRNTGTITEVWKNRIGYRRNSDGKLLSSDRMYIAIMTGCYQMFCVGDQIVPSDRNIGTVVAVSPYLNSIAYENSPSRGIRTESWESIALAVGCVKGFCIGDQVKTPDGYYFGKVIAVNRWTYEIVFLWPNQKTISLRKFDNLILTALNPEFGAVERSKATFPELDESQYLMPGRFFSLQRPQRHESLQFLHRPQGLREQ